MEKKKQTYRDRLTTVVRGAFHWVPRSYKSHVQILYKSSRKHGGCTCDKLIGERCKKLMNKVPLRFVNIPAVP